MFWSIVVTGCEWNWILPVSDLVLNPRSASWRKSTVYGLNGHRLYYIISLFKVTYKSTIQVSRNFHALFTKTLENSYTCD
jgi:hypothetical protein